MVLQKDRPLGAVENIQSKAMSNEQPVTKKQKIDTVIAGNNHLDGHNGIEYMPSTSTSSSASSSSTSVVLIEPPDKVTNEDDEIDNASCISKQLRTSIAINQLQSVVNEKEVDFIEFQESVIRECLCNVNEETLRQTFQNHCNQDTNGVKQVATLSEWPETKLIQFLSNLQLLCDVYLKQQMKGQICCRIMDICDALIQRRQHLVDEIIDLCNHKNPYVLYLASRLLASFFVVSKDEHIDDWINKLMGNLFTPAKVNGAKLAYNLDVIRRIVEWKDYIQHPLDDSDVENDSENEPVHQVPPLESNYFMMHFNNGYSETSTNGTEGHASTSSDVDENGFIVSENGCQMITENEIFETTNLKRLTIKALENKWPSLVHNICKLIDAMDENTAIAEHCVITFFSLWESIISVRANLSIRETVPFYKHLENFKGILKSTLSASIYKQILSLFNEALCYGSTLALQDDLPEETCKLAHGIVNDVKTGRLLASIPERRIQNRVGLLGGKGATLNYGNGLFSTPEIKPPESQIDKTLLQKLVLLVLKSVAVTVKEIRSDSSDSSSDYSSSEQSQDSDAVRDLTAIQKWIRDVLKNLKNYVNHRFEFHPETQFSSILVRLFDDQDDYLIEAMVCTLDVTSGLSFRQTSRNTYEMDLMQMLNPVHTFLEFLTLISDSHLFLVDLLMSNETCFLLYLLRFLKYVRSNWRTFVDSSQDVTMGNNRLEGVMHVLHELRLHISRLVSHSQFPYDISPIQRLIENCESLYQGDELS